MRNIIITGGELFNKGAQAMTFITVDEIKKRFPTHEIYLLSEMDKYRSKEDKEQYNFSFTGWYPLKFAKCQSNLLKKWIYKVINYREYKECESLYKNCDMMIDISGYALGSNWNVEYCNTYLDHLEFAKAFHIPIYLMPQSFGPFHFQGEEGSAIDCRIKDLLPQVKMICAREREGYKALVNRYQLKNVCLKTDLVLNNHSINLENIFKVKPVFDLPLIKTNSVGLVPNGRTLEVKNKEQILAWYKDIIRALLKEGKNVYILSHATADKNLCEEIMNLFQNAKNITFLSKDYSCLEFNEIVKKFDFIIASRFHSIVHAYKNGIPCISLGWAVKYRNLLSEFGQERYVFDVRDGIEIKKLIASIYYLNTHKSDESLKIKEHLRTVQKDNVFDILSM